MESSELGAIVVSIAIVAPEVRSRVVLEAVDQRMAFERLLHDAALDADPAAMDQSHFRQTRRVALR